MMKTLAIAASLLLAACLDSTTESTPIDTDNGSAAVPTVLARDNAGKADEEGADVDVCGMLPANDGACSVACDLEAVMAFIPKGACAVIPCTATDGTRFNTGGCH